MKRRKKIKRRRVKGQSKIQNMMQVAFQGFPKMDSSSSSQSPVQKGSITFSQDEKTSYWPAFITGVAIIMILEILFIFSVII